MLSMWIPQGGWEEEQEQKFKVYVGRHDCEFGLGFLLGLFVEGGGKSITV